MNPQYTMYINLTTGDIERVGIRQGTHPEEGIYEGQRILYHYEPIEDLEQFIYTHYYSERLSALVTREPRPNSLATWNGLAWEWNKEEFLNQIRRERNYVISTTDWALSADTPLSPEQVEEVKQYRQALRDLPSIIDLNVVTKLEEIPWPTKPSFL